MVGIEPIGTGTARPGIREPEPKPEPKSTNQNWNRFSRLLTFFPKKIMFFSGLLTFFKDSNVFPEIPTTAEFVKCPVFLNIHVCPEFERFLRNAEYHRFSQMSRSSDIIVFPDYQRFSGLLTLFQNINIFI